VELVAEVNPREHNPKIAGPSRDENNEKIRDCGDGLVLLNRG
jgi:hypothetical protein